MTFDGEELYPSIMEKASALGFSVIKNHPFMDGNKRTGHAAMETFLVLNGYEIRASVDEQEQVILRVAAGEMARQEFTAWLRAHVVQREADIRLEMRANHPLERAPVTRAAQREPLAV